jgi:hypothetical protein
MQNRLAANRMKLNAGKNNVISFSGMTNGLAYNYGHSNAGILRGNRIKDFVVYLTVHHSSNSAFFCSCYEVVTSNTSSSILN